MDTETDEVRAGFEKLASAAARANGQFLAGADLIVSALLKKQEAVEKSVADVKVDIARGSRSSAKPRRRPL